MTKGYVRAGHAQEAKRQRDALASSERTLRQFLALLDGPRYARILEPGCGAGGTTRYLMDAFPEADIDAFDADDTVLPSGGWPDRVSFRVGVIGEDSTALERAYDLVVVRQVLMELSEPGVAVRWLASRCRPGGRLAIIEPDYGWTAMHPDAPSWHEYYGRYRAWARAHGEEPEMGRSLPGLLRSELTGDVEVSVVSECFVGRTRSMADLMESEVLGVRMDGERMVREGYCSADVVEGAISSLTAMRQDPASVVATLSLGAIWVRSVDGQS